MIQDDLRQFAEAQGISAIGWSAVADFPKYLRAIAERPEYHTVEYRTHDAFLNAAMILSGMGPVAAIQTTGGKLFAGCYALFSGLALITTVAVVFAPIFHRFLHKFHLDAEARER